jgi:hypothetical protein
VKYRLEKEGYKKGEGFLMKLVLCPLCRWWVLSGLGWIVTQLDSRVGWLDVCPKWHPIPYIVHCFVKVLSK